MRRSYDRGSDKAAIHRVSAWVSANRLVLGQVKTDDKSNEITAIPELLKLLDVKGCVVTIDAMGCHGEQEAPYRFISLDRLIADFRNDCTRLTGWRWNESD